jgi:alcohol dehydrogenase class IV
MAFSNSLLGIGHALSHPIGGLYDANHGSVNAVLLPEVLRYDFPVVQEKLSEMAAALGHRPESDCRVMEEMTLETINTLLEAGGTPRSLRRLGVREEDLPVLAQRAARDVCLLTSPRVTDEEDLLALLKRAF